MKDVIVIGAGISGLYSAYKLKQLGIHNLIVVEAGPTVGGRMQTIEIDGHHLSTGAEFLLTTYRHITKLISELSLEGRVVEMHHDSLTFYRNGKYYRFKKKHLLKSLGTSYLSPWSKFKLVMFATLNSFKFLRTDIYGFLESKPQRGNLYEMTEEEITPEFAQSIIEPMFSSIFGYTSKEMLPDYLYYAAKMVLGGDMFTFKSGIDEICHKLSEQLDVKLNTQIVNIARHKDYVEINTTNGETLKAKHVICASAGSNVLSMLKEPLKSEKFFFDKVEYKPIKKVLWRLPHKLSSLKDYVRFADSEVSIRSINYEDPIGEYHYYSCDLKDATSSTINPDGLKKIIQKFIGEKSTTEVELVNQFFWPSAIPKFTNEYRENLKTFLKHNKKDKQVSYVGDYISGSFIDGAMHSVETVFALKSKILTKIGKTS